MILLSYINLFIYRFIIPLLSLN